MSDFAVGSIQQSLLSQAQFQAVMGTTNWVIANGQGVSGSQYNLVTGNTTVPDLRGCYVRMSGDQSGLLGKIQEESVNLDAMTASTEIGGTNVYIGMTGVTTTGNANQLNSKSIVGNTNVYPSFTTKYGAMYVRWAAGTPDSMPTTPYIYQNLANTNQHRIYDSVRTVTLGNHSHALSLSGTFTMTGTTTTTTRTTSMEKRSATIEDYDSTTQPIHLAVNYFIKIN